MRSLKAGLKHAFHVDPPGPVEPTEEQRDAVEWFCRQIAKRHLTTPGLIALEMGRPLNFIAASGMHVFAPGVWAIAKQTTYENYCRFAAFLEHRGSVDYLVQRIEAIESEMTRAARTETDDEEPGAAHRTGP